MPHLLFPMASSIIKERDGSISAFAGDRLVMNFGNPTISHYLRVNKMEQWLVTLEEAMVMPENAKHRYDMEEIYFAFRATIKKHQEEHLQVVSEAPTDEDLQDYLLAYAAAANGL
jgi:hypothetical protein